MATTKSKTIFYRRSHFSTHLPLDAVYSPSHSWIRKPTPGVCRVGLTKFATRMLGEMVDHRFEITDGTDVKPGQILGWVEGFKAISDVYSVVEGTYLRSNPILKEQIALISSDPYGTGWLYEAEGEPDPRCLDAHAYTGVLNAIIDKMLEEQQSQAESDSKP